MGTAQQWSRGPERLWENYPQRFFKSQQSKTLKDLIRSQHRLQQEVGAETALPPEIPSHRTILYSVIMLYCSRIFAMEAPTLPTKRSCFLLGDSRSCSPYVSFHKILPALTKLPFVNIYQKLTPLDLVKQLTVKTQSTQRLTPGAPYAVQKAGYLAITVCLLSLHCHCAV